MKILSVDLATSSYTNLGIILLSKKRGGFFAQAMSLKDFHLEGPPSPSKLATRLADTCHRLSARILLLDGPQAWKHPGNGLPHSRVCERLLNTPGKTGLPGSSKPANYLPFIVFSIEVFKDLLAHGFELWSGRTAPLLAVESFPSSAWRQLGLRPLPAKKKARFEHLQEATNALRHMFPLDVPDGLSHDELQALVAALAGVPLARGYSGGYVATGITPSVVEETWREGFIVNPTREALNP
jgi:hypothetical protein